MVQYFTPEGLKKLKEELEYLKKTEIKRITGLIAEAAAFGDLKENSAYHEARDQKSFLLGRIEQLEIAISEAVVVKHKAGNAIEVGSDVVILFGKEEEKYQIVAPGEANILKNKLSYQSPFGQRLIGKKVGEEFNYEIKDKKIQIKILEIT